MINKNNKTLENMCARTHLFPRNLIAPSENAALPAQISFENDLHVDSEIW